MSTPTLRVAVTTANFLPATALLRPSLTRLQRWSSAAGFAPPELLITRAAVRNPPRDLAWSSVHEVWNPRDRWTRELARIALLQPQSRGMSPYPMDSVLFADGAPSERALFAVAEAAQAVAVVSELQSPITGQRYPSPAACVQVHPDLGPAGDFLPLERVAEIIEARNYGVVLDTNHARRRVRRHPGGQTEIAPPLPAAGEPSLGGVAATWRRLGPRVRLAHFQFTEPAELAKALATNEWPRSLDEFRALLPEVAQRMIPVVIEVNAGWVSPAPAVRFGLTWGPMQDACCRIRDLLVRAAGG